MKIENIIFDFDGTLVDSAPCILNCYERVLEELNIAPRITINEQIIGPPLTATLTLLTGVEEYDDIALMVERFKYYYDERVAVETLPYGDVASLLASLKNTDIKLYIATNKRISPTMKIIKHLDWHDFFISIRAIDQLALGRQSKSTLLSDMLVEHHIDPETALYIGDKQDDAVAAKANNLGFLAASWGYGDWDRDDHATLLAPADLVTRVLSNND